MGQWNRSIDVTTDSHLLFMELDTIQGVRESLALVSANTFLKSEGKGPGRINKPSCALCSSLNWAVWGIFPPWNSHQHPAAIFQPQEKGFFLLCLVRLSVV